MADGEDLMRKFLPPFWAGSPEEGAVMHVLTELLPAVLAPVAEAALSPIMSRVDRILTMGESSLALAHELLDMAKVAQGDLRTIRERLDAFLQIADKPSTGPSDY
jgi:hypothetical protein